MEDILLIRKCPVCDYSKGEVLHHQSFALLENSPLPDNYNIVCCSNCGFVFADTPASQATYNNYYALLSKYEDLQTATGGGGNQYDMERLDATASVIHRFLPDKVARILDVGCANGGLLQSLRNLHYTNVMGSDPSISCSNHVQSLGIKCVVGDLFSNSFAEISEKFDCVILTHVLEHIRDLKKSIENISSKLKENGILYIEVPDASRYADFFTVPYYFIDCEHINHFESNSIGNLILSEKYELLETRNIEFKVGDTLQYPAVYSVFRKTTYHGIEKINFSALSKTSFEIFLDDSRKKNETEKLFRSLIETQEPVIIWGAGQYTLRLLANSGLAKCNLKGIIDSDSNKQGRMIAGMIINKPDSLKEASSNVVICSALHANEIRQTVSSLNSSLNTYIV